MRSPPRRLAAAAALAGVVIAAPGCFVLRPFGVGDDPALAQSGDTAEVLYEKGRALFRDRRWKDAEACFGKVWRSHEGSPYAADARFYEAECRYGRQKWLGAFELYKNFVRAQPLSPHAAWIERRLYDIGEYLIVDGERGFFDTSGEGVDVLEYLVGAFPNGDLADDAYVLIADHWVDHHRPQDAVNALHDLIDRYPGSEWAFSARLRLARAYRQLNRGPRYDADALRRAAAQYGAYIEIMTAVPARAAEYADNLAAARAELRGVEETLGKKGLEESDFYLYDGRVEAARAALRNVIRQWPGTDAAADARRRLGETAAETGGKP